MLWAFAIENSKFQVQKIKAFHKFTETIFEIQSNENVEKAMIWWIFDFILKKNSWIHTIIRSGLFFYFSNLFVFRVVFISGIG